MSGKVDSVRDLVNSWWSIGAIENLICLSMNGEILSGPGDLLLCVESIAVSMSSTEIGMLSSRASVKGV